MQICLDVLKLAKVPSAILLSKQHHEEVAPSNLHFTILHVYGSVSHGKTRRDAGSIFYFDH